MATQTRGFTLNVSADIDALIDRISYYERDDVPFVTAFALTKTAQDIKAEEIVVMARVFDRPTRFTLNALYVKPATKRDLTAEVRFKDGFGSVPAWRYLGPEVEGGPRSKKSFERALERRGLLRADEFCAPGTGVQLDASGNVPGGIITRMLSSLGANPDPLSNTTARSKKRNVRAGKFFILRGVAGVHDGIYERVAGREIRPFMIFVRQPRYKKRFPFYETAQAVFEANFAKNFRIGWARYAGRRAAA